MFFRYGSYTHDDSEVSLTITRQSRENDDRQIVSTITRWTLSGKIHGDDAADLTNRIAALEAAYSQNGSDAALLNPDGSTTAHRLSNASAIGGVRVIQQPSYPQGEGAEYSTYRTYTIVLEAEIAVSEEELGAIPSNSDLTFEESLEFGGGGPMVVVIPMLDDPPIKQVTCRHTPFTATQTGSASRKGGYPPIPPPIWPADLVEGPRSRKTSPTPNGVYRISWMYQFAFAGNQVSQREPNRRRT